MMYGAYAVPVLLLIIAGLVWWFGTKIQERLDILIRQRGGEPPK